MALNKSKKGLFMTILILVLFLLILGELITFALLNVNYNNLDTSLALGSGSVNYGKALSASTAIFASASLSQALKTLANYELNASMRKSNFISNTSLYLTYLMVNGTLPNVAPNSIPANYLKSQMANLTISSYNLSLSNTLNLGAIVLSVNQSKPVIFQNSSYTLTVSYTQNIALNSSSGKFRYQIPIVATISLNNTPDLFYYQQGIARNVRFSQLSNLTTLIGSINATNGNVLGSAYGPIYQVPTGAGGLTCGSLSAMVAANVPAFSFAPYNQMLILATSNAIGITTGASGTQCANQYGGLITYSINSVTMPPSTPWLAYPSATGLLGNLKNGQQVLISGNTLSAYTIQNLISAAGNGYYFASPFVTSYLDRAQASVSRQNPNGLFTLSNYNVQAANFNGVSSYIQVPNSLAVDLRGGWTLSAWVNLNVLTTTQSFVEKYDWVPSLSVGGYAMRVSSDNKIYVYVINGQTSQQVSSSATLAANTWYHIVSTFDNNGNLQVYLNGALNGANPSVTMHSMPSSTTLKIGARGNDLGSPMNGKIANVQIYNQSLAASQVSQLYQEGINGVPPTNSGLVGWWPLNGNPNDYSGQNGNGIPTNIMYSILPNYVRDSLTSITVPTSLSPIPGLLNCNSNSQCSNTLLPHAYLGYIPLSFQQSSLQVAGFNGLSQNSYISLQNPSNTLNIIGPVTVSAWVYPTSTTGLNNGNIYEAGGGCNKQFELFFESSYAKFRLSQYNGGIGGDAIYPVNGLNIWYNIVGVWDGTNQRLYINGTQVATIGPYSGSLVSNPNANSYIGALTPGCNNYDFIGNIANVQVYSAGLSANQVKSIYLSGLQGLPVSSSNALAGWWPLNGNPNDYSGYADHGSVNNVNFPSFSGTYNAPGLSSITTAANEWQVIGIPRSG